MECASPLALWAGDGIQREGAKEQGKRNLCAFGPWRLCVTLAGHGQDRTDGRARHSVRAVVVNQNVLVGHGSRRQRPAGRGLPALPMWVDKSERLKYNR